MHIVPILVAAAVQAASASSPSPEPCANSGQLPSASCLGAEPVDMGLDSCGNQHILLGGIAPDVPWFSLPTPPPAFGVMAGYGPLTAAGAVPGSEPYSDPTMISNLWNADNPAVSGHAQHAGIVRYWATNPGFQVVLPPTDAAGNPLNLSTAIVNSFSSLQPGGINPASNPPAYTWSDWSLDVQQTFAKYSSVKSADISANFGGVVGIDYRVSAIGPNTIGGFIWDARFGGPTGNGINEVILTDQILAGGGGLASVLFDPNTGIIVEADILFDVNFLFRPNSPAADTIPSEFTALAHEIGHFFGLDHSNLHPGLPGVFATPHNVHPDGAVPNSVLEYGGSVPTNVPMPGMVGVITHLGNLTNHVANALHSDDATGMSKLYPVCMPTDPALGPQKLPLINCSARFIGRLNNGNSQFTHPSGAAGVFGVNVIAVPEDSVGGGLDTPMYGTISGITRLSATDGFLFNQYQRPANGSGWFIAQALFGGGPLFSGASVVGASTVSAQASSFPAFGNNISTGDFVIEGVVAAGIDDLAGATAYEILFEERTALSGGLSDWFNESLFYQGNPFDTWGLAPTNIVAGVLRSTFANQDPGKSPLRVIPGSTIALDPVYYDQQVWNGSNTLSRPAPGPFPTADSTGVPFNISHEESARPLVDIQPRTGRFTTNTVSIRIQNPYPTPTVDYLDTDPSATLIYINEQLVGDLVTAITSGALPGYSISPGATVDDFTVNFPLSSFLNHPAAAVPDPQCPPGQTNPLRITVISTLMPGYGIPASTVMIVDDILALGRNDCIF